MGNEYLPCKHEDLNLDPDSHRKSQAWSHVPVTPALAGGGGDRRITVFVWEYGSVHVCAVPMEATRRLWIPWS